jgi:hypothetical protein
MANNTKTDEVITLFPKHKAFQAESELRLLYNPVDASLELFFFAPPDFCGKCAEIEVYDELGRLVWRAGELVTPGLNKTEWRGFDKEGHTVTNGNYAVRLSMGNKILQQAFSLTR